MTQTTIQAYVGDSLKIEPVVQFSGRPFFTWQKDGSYLPAGVQADRQILYISTCEKQHQGTYTFTLNDDYGTAKIQVYIVINEKPQPKPVNPSRIIVRQDTDIELNIGQNANLLCQVHQRNKLNSKIISTTSWIKGNRAQRERFPSNVRPNQERLQIIKFKQVDAGQYTCIVSSSDGSTQVIVVNLRVKGQPTDPVFVPPSARISLKEKSVNEGDNFELSCIVSGTPEPKIEWLINNQKAEEVRNVFVRGNVLYVRDAQVELNGYFTCRALGQDGRLAEDSASIQVRRVEEPDRSFEVRVTPLSSNTNVGDSVRLSCAVFDFEGNTYSSSNELRFSWSKQSGSLPSGAYASGDSLTLYNIQEEDSGSYVCNVENTENRMSGQGVSVVYVTRVQTIEPVEQLRVEVTPKEVSIKQGRDAELVCNVQGGRNPVVNWKKTGESLDPVRHIVQGNKLIIKNAAPTDRGYFECEAESGSDYSRDYALVDIEPREEPKIEIYPNLEQIDLEYGGVAYLQCRIIAGTPLPSTEWTRADGKPLSSKAVVSQEGGLLQINDAGRDEFGVYECVARNEEGEARARVNLVPRGSPQVVEEEKPEVRPSEEGAPDVILSNKRFEVSEGDSVTLNCRTSTRGPHRIDWFSPNEEYLSSDADGNLVLSNVRKDQNGYYTCQVTSSYGNSRDQVYVEVVGSEPAQLRVEVKPKSKSASEGGQAEFTCNVNTDNGESIDQTLIRWSRAGNAPLPQYHTIRGNVLHLYNLNENDGGRYLCTVQASYGRIGFDAAYLQISKKDTTSAFPVYIRVLETPTDSYQPTATFRYGVKVTAECVAQADDVEDIQWSKSEGVSRATYQSGANSKTLIIPALVPMDLGTYVCIAIRRNGERAQNSIRFSRIADQGSQFTYEVQGPTEEVVVSPEQPEQPEQETPEPKRPEQGNNEPPKVEIVGSKQLSVSEGGSAVIECRVEGAESVELSKHGEALPESHRLDKSGNIHRLTLNNLKELDRGYYVCQANNEYGPARDYVYLEVTRAESGQNEEQDRYEREREAREREERERLERERLERERETEELNKNKPLVLVKSLTNGGQIRVGEEFRLACVINDPKAQVYFAGQNGVDGERVQSRIQTNANNIIHELVFSPFTTQDAGSYRCYARNRNGANEVTAVIEAEADESFSFRTGKK